MSLTPGTSGGGGGGGGAGLPTGTAAKNILRYDSVSSTWRAVNLENETYALLTRASTFASLSSALAALLAQSDPEYHDSTTRSASVIGFWRIFKTDGSSNWGGNEFLNNIWPSGFVSPTMWAVLPRYYKYLPNVSCEFRVRKVEDGSTGLTDPVTLQFAHAAFDISINGTPYEVGFVRIPTSPRYDFTIEGNYKEPVVPTTITQIAVL